MLHDTINGKFTLLFKNKNLLFSQIRKGQAGEEQVWRGEGRHCSIKKEGCCQLRA